MTVNVAPLLPLDTTFTYAVPDALAPDAQIGCRVLVPFRNRHLTGVIVAEGPDPATLDFRVKPIADVLDDAPALSDDMLRLTKWIADYYVAGWGDVLQTALPSGTNVRTERRLSRTAADPGDWAHHTPGQRILADLERYENTTLSALRKRLGDVVPLALIRRMADDGVLSLRTTLRDPSVSIRTNTHVRFAPNVRDASADDLKAALRGAKQRAVIDALDAFRNVGTPEPLRTDVMEQAEASYSTIRSLVEKGLLETLEKEVLRSPLEDLPAPAPPPNHTLHDAQQQALDAIVHAIEESRYETFLLHGVTGSGKTEVYIAALKRVLNEGKTGIILVPEIALTPQTVQRFRAHLGNTIAVLHSQMSTGERYDAWRALRDGRFSVAIGPRSAIFAPLENIGLIVVDEEHESSYKQFDPSPRYHARDVAVMRAHMNDAVCVLGSATPSLESTMNARWGKYTLLEMPDRVPTPSGTAQLPDVQVLDLRTQRKKHQLNGLLSDPLREAIQDRLDRNEQVILLQNRRGYAPILECDDCGWVPECRDCSVTLTYHKADHTLRCHYCGYGTQRPRYCPDCGHASLSLLGSGTQRVEEELNAVFPDATTLRMDHDTTRQKGRHHDILQRFRAGGDILLGTQMIAKGLDFERVTLVGVVNADTGLLFPDFRADERTFQLLAQVAGRAGRKNLAGEVYLQTRNPDHAAIRYALHHDYDGFAEETLQDRRPLGYPPFGRIATLAFRGPKRDRTERVARQWTRLLQAHAESVEVFGPQPALVERVERQYRYATTLRYRGSTPHVIQQAIRRARDEAGSVPNGYHVAIDIDAQGVV